MVRLDLERCAAIPDDVLIHEVLVRLPAKSLARCRCVRSSWRAGIAGAAFVRRHLELSRARPPSVLAVPRGESDPLDDYATSTEISFHRLVLPRIGTGGASWQSGTTIGTELVFEKAWPEGITRLIELTHCDGLVAIATATNRVFVCNPATGEFVALPLGSQNAELQDSDQLVPPVALGFDRWRNRYVVGRYFYRCTARSLGTATLATRCSRSAAAAPAGSSPKTRRTPSGLRRRYARGAPSTDIPRSRSHG
jgi:hypothetical protein